MAKRSPAIIARVVSAARDIAMRCKGQTLWLWFWLLVLMAITAIGAIPRLTEGDELFPLDTGAYLETARQVHETGGPLGLISQCFKGTYRQANRMPLYIAFLSTLRYEALAVLYHAKLMTLLLGVLGVAAAFYCARRLFGLPAAIVAGIAVAMNSAYLRYSSVVACEVLFALWVTLAWFCMARYLRGRGSFIWVGATIALAYLTKGSGIFLVPLALVVAVYRERASLYKAKAFWLGVLVFFLIIAPILVRNVRVYGSPFYNFNTRIVWLDSWEQRFSPDEEISAPTFKDYWKTHSLGQASGRLYKGAVQQGIYSVVAAGENTLFHEWLRLKVWPFGLAAILLALGSLWRRQDRYATVPGWLLIIGFSVFFAWYPVKDIRFVFPVLPVLLIMAARGAHVVLRRMSRIRFRKYRIAPKTIVFCFGLVAVTAGVVLGPVAHAERGALTPPPGYFELLEFLRENSNPETVRMMGPSHAYQYPWTATVKGRQIPVPSLSSMEALQGFLDEKHVKHVVVDYSILSQRRGLFSGWFELRGERVEARRTPADWRRVFSSNPPSVMVFEIVPAESAQE